MAVQSIILRTLGDLASRGYGINVMCSHCRHRRDLDMTALVAKLGPEFCYVETQIHVEDAGRRSRFAD